MKTMSLTKKFLVDYFPNICDAKKTIEDTYLGKKYHMYRLTI